MDTMNCGLTCEMLPEVSQVHITKDAYPLDTRGLVLRYADDCAIVFRGSQSMQNYLLGAAWRLTDQAYPLHWSYKVLCT